MTKDEFLNVIRRLIVEARRAELAGLIDDAREAAGYEDVGDFVNSLFGTPKENNKPKLNVVPPKKRIPLGPLLEEGWEWGNKGAFDHRDNPDRMIEFCSPYSRKRNMYLDEMSVSQNNIIEMIHEDVSRAKAKVNKRTSTIEDALDESIKHETSKDTPK